MSVILRKQLPCLDPVDLGRDRDSADPEMTDPGDRVRPPQPILSIGWARPSALNLSDEGSYLQRPCKRLDERTVPIGRDRGAILTWDSPQNGSTDACLRMQQALNFLPDPQGQGSFRPTFFPMFLTGSGFRSPGF